MAADIFALFRCCVGFIVGAAFIVGGRSFLGWIHFCMGYIVRAGLIVDPGSWCWLIVTVGSLLCQVHCCDRFHCWAADILCVVSLLGRVHFRVRFIVGPVSSLG